MCAVTILNIRVFLPLKLFVLLVFVFWSLLFVWFPFCFALLTTGGMSLGVGLAGEVRRMASDVCTGGAEGSRVAAAVSWS